MTAPEPRRSGADGNARGLLVLGVAVAVGFLLLLNLGGGGGGGGGGSTGSADDTSSVNTSEPLGGASTTAATSTTAASSAHQPGEVKVRVLNGGAPAGTAASTSDQIGASGYVMDDATDSPTNVEATTFFYAEGYQEDAIKIANLLGKSTDQVKPLTEAQLNGVEGDANVVVILGPDTPPASEDDTTSSSTTTTAG